MTFRCVLGVRSLAGTRMLSCVVVKAKSFREAEKIGRRFFDEATPPDRRDPLNRLKVEWIVP